MESCSKQRSVKQIKIYFIFEILQRAIICLDDSFAHSWHSLNQLHLECFSNSLEGVPTYAEHLWLLFHHSAVRLNPNHLDLVEVGGLWRPGHLM
jgi:hypothetical protein